MAAHLDSAEWFLRSWIHPPGAKTRQLDDRHLVRVVDWFMDGRTHCPLCDSDIVQQSATVQDLGIFICHVRATLDSW